jgi:flagellar motor switch protein FliN/FliY
VSPEKNPPTAPAVGTALPQLAEEPHSGKPLFALPELSGLKLAVEVPLGSVELDLRGLLRLHVGSILRLEHLTGEPLEVTANGTPIARGEVRIHGERFAVRITEILNVAELAEIGGGRATDAEQEGDS